MLGAGRVTEVNHTPQDWRKHHMTTMTTAPAPATAPVFHDDTYSGTRLISVYVGDVQVAGAVEHRRRYGDYYGGTHGGTFWHVTSHLTLPGADEGIKRTALEAGDEQTARQWLRFLAALYLDETVIR